MTTDNDSKSLAEKIRKAGRGLLENSAPNKAAEGADNVAKKVKGGAVSAVKKLKKLF